MISALLLVCAISGVSLNDCDNTGVLVTHDYRIHVTPVELPSFERWDEPGDWQTLYLTAPTLEGSGLPVDPCSLRWHARACATSLETAARIRIAYAFPVERWRSALHIVRHESQFQPDICYDFKKRGSPACADGRVIGLWQHRPRYWNERSTKTADFYGAPGEVLDIWDPWHSTLVARWLISTGNGRYAEGDRWPSAGGWSHFDTCDESDLGKGDGSVYPHARDCSALSDGF